MSRTPQVVTIADGSCMGWLRWLSYQVTSTVGELWETRAIRWFKWVAPVFICAMSFGFQSIMLHIATMHYVYAHDEKPWLDKPLRDVGFSMLGHKVIPMKLLDIISAGAMVGWTWACIWLRDLRLWVKVFFSASMLFCVKGFVDAVTVLPDSIGWDACKSRLTDGGVIAFERLGETFYSPQKSALDFFKELVDLEIHGFAVGDGRIIWPVRYCSDMVPSGHTFVMLLFLLALADLLRRMTMLSESPLTRQAMELVIGLGTLAFAAADMYLILVNHFHYTIDIFLSIILVLLIYTNAAIVVVTDWFVEAFEDRHTNERARADHGLLWIPPVCMPFCACTGYYFVGSLTEKQVIQRQRNNRSHAWAALTSESVAEYGSTERASASEPPAKQETMKEDATAK